MDVNPNNEYTAMQKRKIQEQANKWSLQDRDHVVGNFDLHNEWSGYAHLFDGIDTTNKVALDFGCGPGRNIVKYWNEFQRIDGVDILQTNISHAEKWIKHNGLDISRCSLYICNGIDLSGIEDNTYDVIFSTICLQHICVYDIRYHYLEEFFRVLKPGGVLTAQMGYGGRTTEYAQYHDNLWNVGGTNGEYDVSVKSPSQINDDLLKIGFKNFEYKLDVVGPGDNHVAWIFFKGWKV